VLLTALFKPCSETQNLGKEIKISKRSKEYEEVLSILLCNHLRRDEILSKQPFLGLQREKAG
jgi:hypothetical protein